LCVDGEVRSGADRGLKGGGPRWFFGGGEWRALRQHLTAALVGHPGPGTVGDGVPLEESSLITGRKSKPQQHNPKKKPTTTTTILLSLSGLSSLPGEGVYRCAPVGGELHLRTADDEEAVPSGGQRRHVCGAESHRYRQREVGGGPPVRVWRIRAHNGAINRTRKSRQGDELLAAISAEAAAHVLRDSGQGPAGIPGVGGASGGPVGTKFATHRGPDLRHVHGRQRRLDAGRGRGGGGSAGLDGIGMGHPSPRNGDTGRWEKATDSVVAARGRGYGKPRGCLAP